MTCLGCTQLEAGPVKTLLDGRVVCHQCEDWRAECEARVVCDMPTLRDRRDYLERVEKARGAAAVDRLKRDIARQWSARHGGPAGGG